MTQVAAIQMASGPNVNANLLEATRLIDEAAKGGAKLVVLPENFALMGMTEYDKLQHREADGSGPIQDFLQEQSKKHAVWLVGGTIPLAAHDAEKVRAACLVFDAEGQRVARYDKVHLFDVSLPDANENYLESGTTEPGDSIVVIDTPFARIGLAICYDLRFPEQFRLMLEKDVQMIVIPSAFTEVTGKAHWEVLVRARAIENLCYVVAAAQGGYHVNGRSTYGNSMVVDPWGNVLAEQAQGAGVITAKIDLKRLENIRRTFPVLEHRKYTCHDE